MKQNVTYSSRMADFTKNGGIETVRFACYNLQRLVIINVFQLPVNSAPINT